MNNTNDFTSLIATHTGFAQYETPGPLSVTQSWGSMQRTYFEDLNSFRAWCLAGPMDSLTVTHESLNIMFSKYPSNIRSSVSDWGKKRLTWPQEVTAGELAQLIWDMVGSDGSR